MRQKVSDSEALHSSGEKVSVPTMQWLRNLPASDMPGRCVSPTAKLWTEFGEFISGIFPIFKSVLGPPNPCVHDEVEQVCEAVEEEFGVSHSQPLSSLGKI